MQILLTLQKFTHLSPNLSPNLFSSCLPNNLSSLCSDFSIKLPRRPSSKASNFRDFIIFGAVVPYSQRTQNMAADVNSVNNLLSSKDVFQVMENETLILGTGPAHSHVIYFFIDNVPHRPLVCPILLYQNYRFLEDSSCNLISRLNQNPRFESENSSPITSLDYFGPEAIVPSGFIFDSSQVQT